MNSFLDSIGLNYFWGKVKSALGLKADASTVYTKAEVDDFLDDMAVTESTVSGWGFTKNTGNVSSTDVTTIVYTTQSAYDALTTKDSNTLYIIPEL